MGLLAEIQHGLMQEQSLAPILLKLRFLASRLGSGSLEAWVKHEADGYPPGADLPDYRKLYIGHFADFSGAFGSGIKNAPIPPYLIKKHAGDGWNSLDYRESVSTIESLIQTTEGSTISYSRGNLMMLLQGNVYPDYACNSVTGAVSRASIVGILGSIRARVLDFTVELEKVLPGASEIEIGNQMTGDAKANAETVTHIAQQTVYGNVTTITNSGAGSTFNLVIEKGSADTVALALTNAGIHAADAKEFAEIVASEPPESAEVPFGPKAKNWIAANVPKALNGTWKIGVAVATQVLTQAAIQFYGLS